MGLSLKPLREQVIVITGASSGIGLVTAQMVAYIGVVRLRLLDKLNIWMLSNY
jgi:NADP-dependent 3-hydroxy acid dehydrogenase YdfG